MSDQFLIKWNERNNESTNIDIVLIKCITADKQSVLNSTDSVKKKVILSAVINWFYAWYVIDCRYSNTNTESFTAEAFIVKDLTNDR